MEESQELNRKELDTAIIGQSPAMVRMKSHILRLGKSNLTVLISGESGTGKELVARGIHRSSPRAQKPFVKVNSAAVPETLFESELFGFEKGAFTGAFRKKPGKFQLAHSGTILLDEVGEIPVLMQAKLLQVLEDNEFSPLGSTSNAKIDARVLAATNANVVQMLSQKTFRLDLYYRLSVVSIHVPALRERRDDIDLLCDHFLRKYAARYSKEYRPLSPHIRQKLCEYSWPGNVRELKNVIQTIAALGNEEVFYEKIRNFDLSGMGGNGGSATAPEVVSENPAKLLSRYTFKEICKSAARKAESDAIADVLSYTEWNRKKAAALLKTSYRTLLDRIKEYEIGKHPGDYTETIAGSGLPSGL